MQPLSGYLGSRMAVSPFAPFRPPRAKLTRRARISEDHPLLLHHLVVDQLERLR
jgi:hypothetical protein